MARRTASSAAGDPLATNCMLPRTMNAWSSNAICGGSAAGSSSPAACAAATSLGEQREPALAERHRVVADGARTGVELAHRGDEEAAAGEDALLDVVEEPLDVGPQPGHAGRRLGRGLDHQLLEDRARRVDRGQLQLLLGAEVREQPALAHADGVGQARRARARRVPRRSPGVRPRAGSPRGCARRRTAGGATAGRRALV